MSHLLGRERSLRQQCRRGRLPVRPAVPDRHGEQASYAGISLPLNYYWWKELDCSPVC